MITNQQFQALTQAARLAAIQLASEIGTVSAATRCGISRDTLGRLAGGLPVQRGSVLSVCESLGLLTPSFPVPAQAISSLPSAGDLG